MAVKKTYFRIRNSGTFRLTPNSTSSVLMHRISEDFLMAEDTTAGTEQGTSRTRRVFMASNSAVSADVTQSVLFFGFFFPILFRNQRALKQF